MMSRIFRQSEAVLRARIFLRLLCKERSQCRQAGARRTSGFSIVESLVSFVVIGIAIAALTELLVANTSWSGALHNKFDNYSSGKLFLSKIGRDIRMSKSVVSGSTTSSLILNRPFDGADNIPVALQNPSSYDPKNNILAVTRQFQYDVVADPNNAGQYLVTVRSLDNPTAIPLVILRGIVGPFSSASVLPSVFQYVERDYDPTDKKFYGVAPQAAHSTDSVIVNFELKKSDFGTDASQSVSKATIVMRSEFFLRNGKIHGQ